MCRNVRDPSRHIAAVRNPDAYRDLMVRVAGFSAYFVPLPPSEQQDLIRRYRN